MQVNFKVLCYLLFSQEKITTKIWWNKYIYLIVCVGDITMDYLNDATFTKYIRNLLSFKEAISKVSTFYIIDFGIGSELRHSI